MPQTVAVDVTPLLPGGENGGAKPFVMELVRRLAALAPDTRFVLLTQAPSHEELATLDARNVSRVQVLGARAAAVRAGAFSRASSVVAHTPRAVRVLAARVGYALNARIKRNGAATALRTIRPELLFCPFTAPTLRERGVPTVCTIYDLQQRAHPEFFSAEDREQRDRAFVDACRHADALAAISDFTRESVMREGKVDAKRVRTIRLRLAAPRSPASTAPSDLAEVGLESRRFLLYPANLWPHKNHERLIAAFDLAGRSGLDQDMRLVCTGAGDERRAALLAQARERGLAQRILFPGFVAPQRLAELRANCAAIVFPSLYEGFGLPVVEGMADGIPVACSRAAALPEIAGDAALFFDPMNVDDMSRAMVSIVADEPLRARLAEAGRRRAQEFADSDRMAREYLAIFEAATAGPRA